MGRHLHIDTLKNRSYTAGRPLRMIRPRLDEFLGPREEAIETHPAYKVLFWFAGLYFGAHILWFLVRHL